MATSYHTNLKTAFSASVTTSDVIYFHLSAVLISCHIFMCVLCVCVSLSVCVCVIHDVVHVFRLQYENQAIKAWGGLGLRLHV